MKWLLIATVFLFSCGCSRSPSSASVIASASATPSVTTLETLEAAAQIPAANRGELLQFQTSKKCEIQCQNGKTHKWTCPASKPSCCGNAINCSGTCAKDAFDCK